MTGGRTIRRRTIRRQTIRRGQFVAWTIRRRTIRRRTIRRLDNSSPGQFVAIIICRT
ncbi:unnamed protein product, partial [Adineta ricciae]